MITIANFLFMKANLVLSIRKIERRKYFGKKWNIHHKGFSLCNNDELVAKLLNIRIRRTAKIMVGKSEFNRQTRRLN